MTDRRLQLSEPTFDEDGTHYTVSIDPTGETLLGFVVTENAMQVIAWREDEARTLATIVLPDPDEARLDAAMARALDAIPQRVELVQIARDDELMDTQIQAAFAGTPPYEAANFDDWEGEARHNGLWSTLEYHVDADDLDLLRADQDRFDELQHAVEERDESDPFTALARNTPNKWMRYALDIECGSAWDTDEEQIDQDVRDIAETLGIEQTPAVTDVLLELVNNAGGGRLHVLWYGAVDELIDAAQQVDAEGKPLPQTITWENPHLLVLNSMSGAGDMVDLSATITLPFDRDRLKLDAKGIGNGYSWSEVVGGLVPDRNTTTVTITANEVAEQP